MVLDEDGAWMAILALRDDPHRLRWPVRVSLDARGRPQIGAANGTSLLAVGADGAWTAEGEVSPAAAQMLSLYLPLAAARDAAPRVVAHLGQSLDGRIATESGHSRYVGGATGILHLHRLRALVDAVIVGAGTVFHDDPRLTVRECAGRTRLRVVIDTGRRLGADYRVFADGEAPTVLICAADSMNGHDRLGRAEILGIPRRGDWLDSGAMIAALAARGVRSALVEGGGVTVSRFLRAGVLNSLQVTVSPVIIGSGRPGIALPVVDSLDQALRPPTRRFPLGDDTLFECSLRPRD